MSRPAKRVGSGCTCPVAQRRWLHGRCSSCAGEVTETQLVLALRLALGALAPRVVIWRNNCGAAKLGAHTVRYGVGNPGGADLLGIAYGRPLAIEVKAVAGRLTEDQETFRRVWVGAGGTWLLARDVDETVAAVTALDLAGGA